MISMRFLLLLLVFTSFCWADEEVESSITDEELYALADIAVDEVADETDEMLAEDKALNNDFTPTMAQLGWVVLVLVLIQLSLLVYIYRSARSHQLSKSERATWFLIVFIFGFIGLFAYLLHLKKRQPLIIE